MTKIALEPLVDDLFDVYRNDLCVARIRLVDGRMTVLSGVIDRDALEYIARLVAWPDALEQLRS